MTGVQTCALPIYVWIINRNQELLIQKRAAHIESHPNKWDISAAGHVSAGDDSITSAIREVHEELGLTKAGQDFAHLFTIKHQSTENNEQYINNEFSDVYLLTQDLDLSKIKIQAEEVSEVKFVHYTELERMIDSDDDTFVKRPEEYQKLFKILYKRFK